MSDQVTNPRSADGRPPTSSAQPPAPIEAGAGGTVTSGPAGGAGPLVIGLDLSITATGIAHTDGRTETFATRTKDGDWRLVDIRRRIADTVASHPTLVVIEDVPPIRANSLVIIGMVHGAVRTLLIRLGVPYALVPPASAKKYATGKGTATKPDMRMALYQRAGLDLRDDNQVDAWWLRAMGLDHLGHPAVNLPANHRQALAKVAWPQNGGA